MAAQDMPSGVTQAPTDNDRLWAALGYPIGVLVPLLILLMEENKTRQFQRYHAIHSLALDAIGMVVSFILGITVIGSVCLFVVIPVWVVGKFFLAYQAYQGRYYEIPTLTKFLRDQKWV